MTGRPMMDILHVVQKVATNNSNCKSRTQTRWAKGFTGGVTRAPHEKEPAAKKRRKGTIASSTENGVLLFFFPLRGRADRRPLRLYNRSCQKPRQNIAGKGQAFPTVDKTCRQGSRVKGPGSKVEDRVQLSRVQGPGSRVQGPGSRVQGPRSRVQGPRSKVQGPVSSHEGPGSRAQGPGSRF